MELRDIVILLKWESDDRGFIVKGLSCEDLETALYAEFFPGFCGCGDPGSVMEFIQSLLEWAGSDQVARKHDYSAQQEFNLKVLDAAKLLEHGSSVGGSWLSPRGEILLKILQTTDWKEGEKKTR